MKTHRKLPTVILSLAASVLLQWPGFGMDESIDPACEGIFVRLGSSTELPRMIAYEEFKRFTPSDFDLEPGRPRIYSIEHGAKSPQTHMRANEFQPNIQAFMNGLMDRAKAGGADPAEIQAFVEKKKAELRAKDPLRYSKAGTEAEIESRIWNLYQLGRVEVGGWRIKLKSGRELFSAPITSQKSHEVTAKDIVAGYDKVLADYRAETGNALTTGDVVSADYYHTHPGVGTEPLILSGDDEDFGNRFRDFLDQSGGGNQIALSINCISEISDGVRRVSRIVPKSKSQRAA